MSNFDSDAWNKLHMIQKIKVSAEANDGMWCSTRQLSDDFISDFLLPITKDIIDIVGSVFYNNNQEEQMILTTGTNFVV